MQWANPNINASIYSLIQVHYFLSKYQTLSTIIRTNAIQLLSPSTTGNIMNNRLTLIGYCLCFIYKLQPYYMYSYKCDPSVELNSKLKYSIIEKEYQQYQQLYNYQHNNFNKVKNEKISLSKQPNSNIQKFCEEQILGKRILFERYKRLKGS